mmetsp:Transcript_32615/g.52834  ORF Transcript_32615/g.52834 Transcript_32615/m.52834 type:complete len:93 (-) Transcript_32615:357-635(-)
MVRYRGRGVINSRSNLERTCNYMMIQSYGGRHDDRTMQTQYQSVNREGQNNKITAMYMGRSSSTLYLDAFLAATRNPKPSFRVWQQHVRQNA